jgi:hypothetical protein
MKRILMAAGLLLVVASHTSAQVSPGLSEINLNGHVTVTSPEEGDSFTMMQLQLRYGYFLTQAVQVGAQFTANKFEDVDAFGEIGAFGAFHFGAPGALMVPYAGVQVGTGFGMDDSPFSLGGFAGLKYFLGAAGAISPELFVTRFMRDTGDWTTFGVRVGVSVFVGGS